MQNSTNPQIFPAGQANFQLAIPNGELELLTVAVENPRGIAVICHPHPLQAGTMNNKVVTTLHKAFHEANMHTVRFNFRGVGKSTGEFAEGIGEAEDLIALLDWVAQLNPDLPLYLAGFSFGSYVSYRVASLSPYKNKLQQLISIAPPLKYPEFPKLPLPACPWLIVQGEQDEIVEPQVLYDWLEQHDNPATLIRFSDTGHFFHGKLIELREVVLKNLM